MTALTLHSYQQEAVEYIRHRKRAGLFLDMGLGKTAICLRALQPEHLPVLVNAPKRVAENVWPEEGPKWRPDLRVRVAAGTPAQRKAALESDADIIVIGRDNLADAVPYASKFKTHIIDELSGFKTRSSLRWKAAKKLCGPAMEQVWGLTGTPSPNGLLDLWAQLYLLDGGEALGTTLGGYRERYFSPGRQLKNGTIIEYNLRPGADKRIHALLERTCLAMSTDGRIDLPEITFNNIEVPLNPQTRRFYKQMKDDLVVDMEIIGGEIHSAVNAAVLSNKLSQISAGFMYVDDAEFRDHEYKVIHKEKVNALREIVDGTGSPVLVGYQYQAEFEMLKEGLGEMAHGIDEPDLQKRWNNGEFPVLLAHPDSVGHGLNLQFGGHTMVWASLPWSLEQYQQMNKRLARQGQKNPVVIHHLLSPKTIDYKKLAVLEGKESIQSALMGHLESPL